MNKQNTNKLKNELHEVPIKISERHLAETVRLSHLALQRAEPIPRFKLPMFIFSQIRFVGLKIWGIQAVILLVLMIWLNAVLSQVEIEFHHIQLPLMLSIFGVLMALPGIYYLERSIQHQMIEIELSTFVSMPRLIIARLIIIGFGDAIMLTSSLIFVETMFEGTGYAVGGAMYFMVIAFVLACLGCLLIVDRIRSKHAMIGCIMFGTAVITILNFLNVAFPEIFKEGILLAHWVLILLLLISLIVEIFVFIWRSRTLDTVPTV